MVIVRFVRCREHYAQHSDAFIDSDDERLIACKRRCAGDSHCAKFTMEISQKNCFLYRDESACSGGNRDGRDFVSGFKGLTALCECLLYVEVAEAHHNSLSADFVEFDSVMD